jgi:uncharacterized Zn finger protein (UPF0148 family)
MDPGMITCPSCGHAFELSDALTGRIREHLRGELLQEVARREAELKKKSESLKELEAQVSKSREAINEEIEERLNACRGREKAASSKGNANQLKELQSALEEKDASIKTQEQGLDQPAEAGGRKRVPGTGSCPHIGRGAGKDTRGRFEEGVRGPPAQGPVKGQGHQ